MGILFSRGFFGLFFTMVVVFGSAALGQSGLAVSTKTGQTLSGEIDNRSDQRTLWIRTTQGNVILTTALAWSEIIAAELAGKPIKVGELAENIAQYTTSAPAAFLTEFELKSPETLAAIQPVNPVRKPNLATLQIEAGLVNLDRTVELDGLLVALAVFDTDGAAVSVRGSISARLIVQITDQHTGRISFQEFQRWSTSIVETDFSEGFTEVPLKFRRASPDFNWELCSSAILNVRLGVPGQGNYEASAPVVIREINPLRDQMQNLLGSRFYRNELTHATRQDGPRHLHQGYQPTH